jgi:ornithine cyclodeaminase/alanine dehydrogenase-like protein (mu-crystallin family)
MIGLVPTSIRLIPQSEVARLLDLDLLLDSLERAFKALSAGSTSVPPRTAARVPDGLLGVMPGYVPGLGLEAKLVTVFPGNHERGLPSHQALIAIFDESDGRPLAIMDGTEITAVRTGASTAVSVRALAPEGAGVLAILGAGVQGGTHLRAVTRVRDFQEVRIASRDRARAERLDQEFQDNADKPVRHIGEDFRKANFDGLEAAFHAPIKQGKIGRLPALVLPAFQRGRQQIQFRQNVAEPRREHFLALERAPERKQRHIGA